MIDVVMSERYCCWMEVMYSPGSKSRVIQVVLAEVPIASRDETFLVAVSTSFNCSPVIFLTDEPLTVSVVVQLTRAVAIMVLLKSDDRLAEFVNLVSPVDPP